MSVGRFLSQIDIGERLAVSVTYLEPARNLSQRSTVEEIDVRPLSKLTGGATTVIRETSYLCCFFPAGKSRSMKVGPK